MLMALRKDFLICSQKLGGSFKIPSVLAVGLQPTLMFMIKSIRRYMGASFGNQKLRSKLGVRVGDQLHRET